MSGAAAVSAGWVAQFVALPLAHIGHWLWVFYLIPVLIVVAGIIRSSRAEKRRGGSDSRQPPKS